MDAPAATAEGGEDAQELGRPPVCKCPELAYAVVSLVAIKVGQEDELAEDQRARADLVHPLDAVVDSREYSLVADDMPEPDLVDAVCVRVGKRSG